MSDDSPEDRQRVFSRIAPLIMEFRGTREVFHAEELRDFIRERVPETAPDSPGRILRELRLRGWLDYQVVNRHQSLYQFIAPKEEEPMDDCVEPYRECVRSRQDRVRRVIEDNPGAPKSDLAKLAGVSEKTIQLVKNSTAKLGEKAFSPPDTVEFNVVPMRRRRPDWRPRQPRDAEVWKWFQQYLNWTPTAKATARMFVLNHSGALPDEAYTPESGGSSDSSVGQGARAGSLRAT